MDPNDANDVIPAMLIRQHLSAIWRALRLRAGGTRLGVPLTGASALASLIGFLASREWEVPDSWVRPATSVVAVVWAARCATHLCQRGTYAVRNRRLVLGWWVLGELLVVGGWLWLVYDLTHGLHLGRAAAGAVVLTVAMAVIVAAENHITKRDGTLAFGAKAILQWRVLFRTPVEEFVREDAPQLQPAAYLAGRHRSGMTRWTLYVVLPVAVAVVGLLVVGLGGGLRAAPARGAGTGAPPINATVLASTGPAAPPSTPAVAGTQHASLNAPTPPAVIPDDYQYDDLCGDGWSARIGQGAPDDVHKALWDYVLGYGGVGGLATGCAGDLAPVDSAAGRVWYQPGYLFGALWSVLILGNDPQPILLQGQAAGVALGQLNNGIAVRPTATYAVDDGSAVALNSDSGPTLLIRPHRTTGRPAQHSLIPGEQEAAPYSVLGAVDASIWSGAVARLGQWVWPDRAEPCSSDGGGVLCQFVTRAGESVTVTARTDPADPDRLVVAIDGITTSVDILSDLDLAAIVRSAR